MGGVPESWLLPPVPWPVGSVAFPSSPGVLWFGLLRSEGVRTLSRGGILKLSIAVWLVTMEQFS